jgi:hypothetical protein
MRSTVTKRGMTDCYICGRRDKKEDPKNLWSFSRVFGEETYFLCGSCGEKIEQKIQEYSHETSGATAAK